MARDEDAHTSLRAQQPQSLASSALDRVTKRPSKPNAYSYYQKLVQDFQSLDDELRSAALEQEALERKVQHLHAQEQVAVRTAVAKQQQQWMRERDVELERVVGKNAEVAALHAQVDELEALELRLVAEIELLQEKQQTHVQTEAQRIHELVHTRTHLLDAELAKGRLDLEFIAQVVQKTHAQDAALSPTDRDASAKTDAARDRGAIHALADAVQQRRRVEFDTAAERLRLRLASFEHEQDVLRQKAQDIRTRKQRALQILSTNQQAAIKTFFATPRSAHAATQSTIDTADASASTEEFHGSPAAAATPAPPELDFASILASLNQSGAQVAQLQSTRQVELSARKSVDEALRDAQTTLVDGEERIRELEQAIASRKREADALGVSPNSSAYDGALGIESYAAKDYALVYLMRALVLSWIDAAVARAEAAPSRQVLESELVRWEVTHTSVALEQRRHERTSVAHALLASLISEATQDIARSIHAEFDSSCARVRSMVASTLHSVFFAPSTSAATKTTPIVTPPALAASLFRTTFTHLQATRTTRAVAYKQRTNESVELLPQRTQPLLAASSQSTRSNAAALKVSPTESSSPKMTKRFGFFRSSKPSKPLSEAAPAPPQALAGATPHRSATANATATHAIRDDMAEPVIELRVNETPSPISIDTIAQAKAFWQRMRVDIDALAAPASFAHASCVEVATDSSVCVVGTTSGEVLVWDLLQRPPLLLRSHVPPAKAARASIVRIALSANCMRVLTLNALHVAHVWRMNAATATAGPSGSRHQQAAHSSDCFSAEAPSKWKPVPLELLGEVTSETLVEPSAPERVRQLLPPPVSAALSSTGASSPPHVVSMSFFASYSLLLCDQSSVVCGVSNGDIIKRNFVGTQRSDIAAAFDAPHPSQLAQDVRTDSVMREFLRGHRHPVLFVASLPRSARQPQERIVSIDSDANVYEWVYARKHFAGVGWFTPSRQYRLDLQAPHDGSSGCQHCEILQIASTADHQRVVLMVFAASPSVPSTKKKPLERSGTLLFYQLELSDPIRVLAVRIALAYTTSSAPAPRFALTTLKPRSSARGARSKRRAPGRHYLFLLVDNSVAIYSLDSGERCCAPIALLQTHAAQRSDASLVYDAIAVSAWCERNATPAAPSCCVVVTGARHSKALVHRFQLQPQ